MKLLQQCYVDEGGRKKLSQYSSITVVIISSQQTRRLDYY